jgi:hypothetical protein
MDSREILESIKKDLGHEQIDSFIQHEDEAAEARLLIYAGENQEKVQLLSITARNTELNESESLTSLQFEAFFPFIVKDQAVVDVSQFLHFLNQQLEVPGFYFNHLDHLIAFRYILFIEPNAIPKKIVMSLIGLVIFFQDIFTQTLERLAKGEVSFADLMQEVHDLLSKAIK